MSRRSKESFDAVAGDYDLYRPAPPSEVLDALVAASKLRTGSKVLEIGCGTGQLSVPLARHGVDLLAVELGPRLAAIARRNLSDFPNARVEIGSFEDAQLPARSFDAVVSASAFHWLDPQIRISKCAEALSPGGCLTILHVHHVRGGTPGFVEDTQPYYRKWGLSDDPFFQPPAPDNVPIMYPELDDAPEFSSVERRQFEIAMQHSATSYVGWLRTDSLIGTLDHGARAGFLDDIEQLITSRYHGSVARNFVYDLVIARQDGLRST